MKHHLPTAALCAATLLLLGGRSIAAPAETNGNPLALLDRTLTVMQGRPDPAPGAADATVAPMVAALLQQWHFLQQPFDDEVSERFLTRFLDRLDPQHSLFFQADIEEFDAYRTALDDLTKRGDTSPAYAIFTRYLQRLEEWTEYAAQLLARETFEFTGNDSVSTDRRKAAYPADVQEARHLWRQHLRHEYLQEILAKQTPDAILTTLARRYALRLRTMKETETDSVLEYYLTSLAHVFDPHSDYFSKADLETFSIAMKLSLVGIGAHLESEDGYCRVMDLVAGGPAARSGQLKARDRIVGIAQGAGEFVDVVDMSLNKVVELLRGPKGTEVRLQVLPNDAADLSVRKVVSLIRDEIKLEDQQASERIVEMPLKDGRTKRIGYIELPSFYADFQLGGNATGKGRSTSKDVAALLKKSREQGVQGIILDLRRNGGGSLEEAVKLTGLFIKTGPVVQIKDRQGRIQVDEDGDPAIAYDGPLLVLTSRFSASASEIVAAALQDHGRALIVGDSTTHGKGTVQQVIELDPVLRRSGLPVPPGAGGALKLTLQKFYRANGGSTQLKGVTPDIALPSPHEYAEMGECSLDNSLPWDEVPRAAFASADRVQPFVGDLKRRSDERLAQDRDADYLREDIEEFRRRQEARTVLLNEQARLQEREAVEARLKERETERVARHEPPLKEYDLTVARAEKPGLPAPAVKRPASEAGQDDKPSPVDVTLKESRRILLDYIELASSPVRIVQSTPSTAKTSRTP